MEEVTVSHRTSNDPSQNRTELSRRALLRYGGALTAAGAAAPLLARSGAAMPAAAQTPVADYKQAPMLDARVESGELPPVAERLPANPMVLEPVERIGQYGGDWNSNFNGDYGTFIRQIGYEGLVRWQRSVARYSQDEVIPNLAERVDISPDGATYTFSLRQGVKWSDGEPFTSADILYWYEHVLLNEELTPVPPDWMVIGGRTGTVEAPDDATVVFRFAGPHGLFLQRLASGANGLDMTGNPRHYLEQYHPAFNPDAIRQAEAAGLPFVDYYNGRREIWSNPEVPVLNGWRLTSAVGENTQQLVAERNPYYWKVDPDGNQLPYLDRVVYSLIDDANALSLRALNGDQDMYEVSNTERPLFFDNQERGGFRLLERTRVGGNVMPFSLNLTHPNPVLRELFQNKDFRIGLSHAINRQEIIDIVYVGQGAPNQVAPPPESAFYDERLATQYLEYSVEQANAALDKVVPNRNSDGLRLLADGNPVRFVIEVISRNQEWTDGAELLRRYFGEVGVEVQVRPEDDALWRERINANQIDATMWGGSAGEDILLDPSGVLPIGDIAYAKPWAMFYQEGPDAPGAEEPVPAAKRQQELYRQIQDTIDSQRQVELMREIMAIAADEFWLMGVTLPAPLVAAVRNDFRNVPETMIVTWTWPTPAPSDTAQYFREQ
jgi:peptide/nickel transport system substrate-binding protein